MNGSGFFLFTRCAAGFAPLGLRRFLEGLMGRYELVRGSRSSLIRSVLLFSYGSRTRRWRILFRKLSLSGQWAFRCGTFFRLVDSALMLRVGVFTKPAAFCFCFFLFFAHLDPCLSTSLPAAGVQRTGQLKKSGLPLLGGRGSAG